ncbi:MAG TPA: peptidoglycan-associated lipoprotein Pal [Vicinamibacterales bacterium]
MPVKRVLIVLAMIGAAAACHKKPPATAPAPPAARAAVPSQPPASPAPPAPAPAAPHTPSAQDLFDQKSLAELNAEHPLNDAFFDLDQTTLRDDARQALQQDAQWLAKWPTTKITVEGHCDERGTAEYNLALGDRRARQVTQYLESLGVSPTRIGTESMGKEAPFCKDSTESCWSQNRRGHFVITAK